MSNGKDFFHSFQTCNLIGRLKDLRDDALMTQEDNTIEISYKWSRKFQSDRLKLKKWSTSRTSSVCSGEFPCDPRVLFAFQPAEPKIWLNIQCPCCLTTHDIQANYIYIFFTLEHPLINSDLLTNLENVSLSRYTPSTSPAASPLVESLL